MKAQVATRRAAAVWLLLGLCPVGHGSWPCSPLVTCPKVLSDPELSQSNSPERCTLSDHSYGVDCRGDHAQTRKPVDGYSYRPPQGYLPPPTTGHPELITTLPPPRVRDPLPVRLTEPERLLVTQLDQNQTNLLACMAQGAYATNALHVLSLAVDGRNVAALGSVEQLQFFFSRLSSRNTAMRISQRGRESVNLLENLAERGAVIAGLPDRHSPLTKFRRFHFPDLQASIVYQTMNHLTPNCTLTNQPFCGTNTIRFRTHDGTCNNLLDALRGSANSPYERFFPSDYEDGIDKPRARGFDGSELPNPRLISIVVGRSNTEASFDKLHTIGLMLFSQFIDHDLTSTPATSIGNAAEGSDEKALTCCGEGGLLPAMSHDPQNCIPILIPHGDPDYNISCMNQLRSVPATDPNCVPRPTAQQNQITHYLDGSNIYGSSDEESQKLRVNGPQNQSSGGRIQTTEQDLLRRKDNNNLLSGDMRTSENLGLTFFHLVWTREHNRVAAKLAERHYYDDEQLYQEARRIVIAEYQHTVYNEWLPTILGYDFAVKWGLIAGAEGAYDQARRAVIANEFSTAAFRFGHSMVHDVFRLGESTLKVSETFFDATLLRKEIVRALAESLTSQQPGWVDRDFSDSIRKELFERADLIALNINRGRDHGLQPYVAAVEHCHNRIIDSWEDYEDLVDSEAIEALRKVYRDYRDVDLYIGLVSETRAPDAVVGPTLQCLIGQQFVDLRLGDRFFYDNMGMESSFTEAQLAELKRSSLARIYCDNVEDLHEVQPLVLLQPEFYSNSRQSCDSQAIPTVDLSIF